MILFTVFSLLITAANAHMLMKSPLPRGYKGNPAYQPIDYDLKSPLPSLVNKNRDFIPNPLQRMCNGKPPGPVSQTIQAGQTINVSFEGSAKHGGVQTNKQRMNGLFTILLGNLSIFPFL